MASLIGALRVTLSADTAAFQKGMKAAERQAKTSSASINKSLNVVKSGVAGFLAGFTIDRILQAGKAALDFAGSLGEVAQQLGVTTKELQVFRFAVQQNGGSIEDADKSLGKFTLSISKALSGSKQQVAAFRAVGVELGDLQNKSKLDVLGQIADRMKATGGASINAAAGVAIFGKGFQKIVPVLDQGSAGMSELAMAAEELGIVLSDEQIQKADETADKIDALYTVIQARIAGAVADNSDAVISLGEALAWFVDKVGDALRAWNDFKNALDAQAFEAAANNPFLSAQKRAEGARRAAISRGKISDNGVGWGVGGSSVTVTLAPVKRQASSAATGSPSRFLAGGGGGRKTSRAPRDTSLRDAFQFEDEQRRAEMEILRAKQALAHDYVDRTALSVQMLNLEKEGFEAELKFRVASGDLKKSQADALRLKNDEVDRLQRMAVLEEEEEARQRDYNALDDKDFELKLRKLELEADLAETTADRRSAELKILNLTQQEERNKLERIIRESKDWAEIEAARRELLDLTQRQSLERQAVMNRTRNPFEQAQAEFSDLSDEMSNLKVQGIMGAADALTALATATDDWGKMAIDTVRQVIAEFIRLQTIKFLLNAAGSLAGGSGGGLPFAPSGGAGSSFSGYVGIGSFMGGFASGGNTLGVPRNKIAGVVHGQEGILNPRGMARLGVPNLNALNSGAPIAAIGNDNAPAATVAGGDTHVHVTPTPGMRPHEARATGRQIGRGARDAISYGVTGRRP